MYIAFIDESGKPDLRSDEPFVLSALILHDSSLSVVRKELAGIKLKYDLDPSIEFHARDIVHGKRAFSGIRDMAVRKKILNDLFSLISNLNATLISVVVKKHPVLASMVSSGVTATKYIMTVIEAKAYELLTERLVLFLQNKAPQDEWMLLVIDEVYSKHDLTIRKNVENVILKGFFASRWPASKRIFPQPLFASSSMYDLVSYTVRKIHTKPVSASINFQEFFNLIKKKFDRCNDGRLYGCGIKVMTISKI